MSSRYKFIDLLRGLAIFFMVLNHTARWWLDGRLSLFRYDLIYATVTLAGPLFLFLVGFCLSLSFQKALIRQGNARMIWKYLSRGFGIIIVGYIFSFVVFGYSSMWQGRVLQAIGMSIIISLPILYLLRFKNAWRSFSVILILLPVSFWIFFQPVSVLVSNHSWLGEIFFMEFPLWPYFSLVLLGLLIGKYFVDYCDDREKLKLFFTKLFNWGMILTFCAIIVIPIRSIIFSTPMLSFQNDYVLNDCWIPGPIILFWIIGAIFILLSLAYFGGDRLGTFGGWLERLGQASLFAYVFHHLIIFNLFYYLLQWRIGSIFLYFLDVLVLIVFLVYSSKLWLWLKRLVKKNLNPTICFQSTK